MTRHEELDARGRRLPAALAAGATPAEIQHLVTLAIPTVGFPTTIAAFTWVGDVLSGRTKGPTGGTPSGSSR